MAVISNFGVPVDGAEASTLMPKLQYRFRVRFLNLGSETGNELVTQNVISAGRPSLTHEEIVVDSYNSKIYLAGKHTWEAVSIVLRDDMNSNVIKQIGAQLNRQLDHADQASARSGASYKFTTFIETLDGGNGGSSPEVFDTWELSGCYLSNVQYGELNYGTSDMVQVTMQIRFDTATHEVDGTGDVLSDGERGTDGEGATV
jgi:hypothetical protein